MNSYPSPQYRQEDQNQGGILDTLGKIALTAGAGVGLLYGLNPKLRQSARQRIADIVNDPKVVENVEKVRAVSKTSPETVTTALRSERPRGTQVINLNPSSFKEFSQQADQIAAKAAANIDSSVDLDLLKSRLVNEAALSAKYAPARYAAGDPYVPVPSSEPPSWQSAGNMDRRLQSARYYGARRNKGTIRAIEQARRQAAADTYVNAIRSIPDSYQLSIPGVNPELIALRSKEGLPSPGELTGIAESRPLSAAPEQGSFALTYNQARGAVAPDVSSRLKAKGLGMAGMPGEGPLEIDFEGRRTAINSPAGEALLKSAGVTAAEAESYWSNKLRAQGLLEETSVEAQKFNQPLVSNQAIEAIDTGADQASMRVSRTVQRDPGESLAAFDQIQDAYEQRGASPVQAADAAVAATEGNVAFTQTDRPLTESSTARFLANERDEIASQLAEQGLLITPGRIEGELANRLGSQAYKYGPEYTQLKQNIQLGATYDPDLFNNPSKPFVRVAGEEVPTGRVPATKIERTPYTNELIAEDVELGLRQPTYMEETAQRLQERAAEKKDWLGNIRLEEQNNQIRISRELDKLSTRDQNISDYIDYVESEFPRKASYSSPYERNITAKKRYEAEGARIEQEQISNQIENLLQQAGKGQRRVAGAERSTQEQIASLTPPSRLKPGVEEGQRVFFEADEFGQPIPGTQEFRSERKMVDMKPKGGGGRNVAEFSAGNRDEEIDLENILQRARTPRDQSAREYTKDQFGYRPGTGLTGEALEGQPFTDDLTQTGRVITRTGIQKTGPQPGSMKAAVSPYTQLDDETLGMISLQGSEADAVNAARVLARRRREGYDPSTVAGPGQSQRVVSSVALTPEQKQTKINSMDASRYITALQRSGRPDAQQLVQQYIQKLQGGI